MAVYVGENRLASSRLLYDCDWVNDAEKLITTQGEKPQYYSENERKINSLSELLNSPPDRSTDLILLAKAISYFFNGNIYKVIEDPLAFQHRYENPDSNSPLSLSSCSDHFDTSPIRKPEYSEGKFVFFVEKGEVPFRVSFSWPSATSDLKVDWELLAPS